MCVDIQFKNGISVNIKFKCKESYKNISEVNKYYLRHHLIFTFVEIIQQTNVQLKKWAVVKLIQITFKSNFTSNKNPTISNTSSNINIISYIIYNFMLRTTFLELKICYLVYFEKIFRSIAMSSKVWKESEHSRFTKLYILFL